MTKAVVVGAGLGGIVAAARLACAGYQVEVYEKGAMPGGRAYIIQRDGYLFDAGSTLFLMPEVWAETFQALGDKMEDHLDLTRLDPTKRVHSYDGSKIGLTSNLVAMREQLDILEPGSYEAYLRVLSEGYRFYNLLLGRYVGRKFYTIFQFLSLSNFPLLFQLKALAKHASNTARFFKYPHLQAAFSFQNMYLSLSPYDAPVTYSLLMYTELGNGVWFLRWGLYSAIKSFVAIALNLGVRFQYNDPVEKINFSRDQVKGITLEKGEFIPADLVVANADLPYVYLKLFPNDGSAAKLNNKKYSSSALMFYWGIKGEKSSELLHHNVFLTNDKYKSYFDRIIMEFSLPIESSFYINSPLRTESGYAPPNGDGIMVLVLAGHLDETRQQDWLYLQDDAKKYILSRLTPLGIKDIEKRMVFEDKGGHPYYLKELNLANGSAFGLSHNFLQVGYFRPQNRHSSFKNFFFAGASTQPGTGLPIVLLSARLVVKRILKEGPQPDRLISKVTSTPVLEHP